jgi:hypothetical protein
MEKSYSCWGKEELSIGLIWGRGGLELINIMKCLGADNNVERQD